jgi:hypothetical protein
MPETAIYENSQSSLPKYEIRFAKNLLIAPPAGDAMPPQ